MPADRQQGPADRQQVRAWRPAVPGVREVVHARFDAHAYPLHTHGSWTVIRLLRGDIRFTLGGRPTGSAAGHVSVLPPGVAHDGRAGPAGAFRKQVLHLDGGVLPAALTGAAVDAPTAADAAADRLLARVHRLLTAAAATSPAGPPSPEALAAEEAVAELAVHLAGRLRPAAGARRPAPRPGEREALAEQVRAALDACLPEGATMAAIAAEVGASTTRLARAFRATYGLPPHAYVVGRRVELARGLLLDGAPPAEVAALAGFTDQPHLTRHFRRAVGTTPAAFQRGARAGSR